MESIYHLFINFTPSLIFGNSSLKYKVSLTVRSPHRVPLNEFNNSCLNPILYYVKLFKLVKHIVKHLIK